MSHLEHARDNQWWYTQHPDRKYLDRVFAILLVVDGRRCLMTHSATGKDGRVTSSFKFDLDADREVWKSLRGKLVTLAIENLSDPPTESKEGRALHEISLARIDSNSSEIDTRVVSEKEKRKRRVDQSVPLLNKAGKLVRKRSSPTHFDAYLFCDWSANSKPKVGKDSIWFAEGWFEPDGVFVHGPLENPSTRAAAEIAIRDRICTHKKEGRRILVGFDFPLSYPETCAARLVGDDTGGWRDLWQMLERGIVDDENNKNNRFEFAGALNEKVGESWYWGRPEKQAIPMLHVKKDGRGKIAECREIELSLKRSGLAPFTVWQLLGNGAVGSQTLVGLPCCERMRANKALELRVWPFETGFLEPHRENGLNILVEVWPGAINVDMSLAEPKDAAQMLSLVEWAATNDAAGTLAPYFTVQGLTGRARDRAESTEGWILGWMKAAPGSESK